ncbi:MAG: glycosyltransferase family 4 protein [Synechococcales bacterium]|nr:glycosyltransferase family 4 protein [Synechococcales bacterium]
MRVLMLSSTFPYPPSRGGTEVRTFHLLQYLQQHHEVTLVTQRQPDVTDEEVAALEELVTELAVFPLPMAKPSGWIVGKLLGKVVRLLGAIATGIPPNVRCRYSTKIQSWVDRRVRDGKFDVITCEHGVNAVYVRPAWRRRVRTVLNAHSLSYPSILSHLRVGAAEQPGRDRLYLATVRRYETRYQRQFSAAVVTTPDDQREFIALCPGVPVHIVPNGVDLVRFPLRAADPGGDRLVFVGAMDSTHNLDAAKFFVEEIMPLLRQRYPSLQLSIVGARPTDAALKLGRSPGVTVTGAVPSVVDYLHQAVACVVPLRTGFGIKNKTLEAMATGVPVVASDRGLEGLSVDEPNQPLRALRANTPPEYVDAICRLIEDPALRESLSRAGRSLIETTYTWERAGAAYEQILINKC